jgi:hypothetical protein
MEDSFAWVLVAKIVEVHKPEQAEPCESISISGRLDDSVT